MNPFKYREQIKDLSTPFYLYDSDLLRETLQKVRTEACRYGYTVHYAMKANANLPILKLVNSFNLGVDCVSGNEIKRALEAGFQADEIVFAGVGKSDWEIEYSLDKDVFSFNCESIQEIEVINEIAVKKRKIASICIRINPGINPNTHHYITTGIEDNKFGIHFDDLEQVIAVINDASNIKLIGIHLHIGSQIKDFAPFKHLCLKVNDIQRYLRNRSIDIQHINLGGGLGVNYEDPDKERIVNFQEFFSLFNSFLELYPGQTVHFELGRSIVAHSASLLSKVLYLKKGLNTTFVVIDAGMTELIRPALYQAYHKIENLTARDKSDDKFYDVVGPICESSDCFGKKIKLPETKRGDLIAIRSTGAYGEVMASGYNLRQLAPAYYTDSLKE